jgi:hypothetical protein
MKAKILKRFVDKSNKVIHPVGKVIEVTEDRFEEILEKDTSDPFIKRVESESDLDLDPRLDGNVPDVKNVLDGLVPEELILLLEEEKINKNRKGVIEHIEHLLVKAEEVDDSGETEEGDE